MRTVKIRRWDDMAEEFGSTNHGDIKTIPPFVKYMKELCGKTIMLDECLCYDAWEFSEEMFEPDDDCMIEGCGRKRRKGENMCTTCTIAALRFELTKTQKKIKELTYKGANLCNELGPEMLLLRQAEAEAQKYRRALVRIEANGLGATATAGYICSNIAEMALKQGYKT